MAIEKGRLEDGTWGELIVADIQVEVFDFAPEDDMKLLQVLQRASGREVSMVLSERLYAYFSDGDLVRAHAAQLDAETAAYCKTRLRRGSFIVNNLRFLFRKDASYCTASVEEVRAAAEICGFTFLNDNEVIVITHVGFENTPQACAIALNRMIECFPEKFVKGRK
jgi:hypothetical protein